MAASRYPLVLTDAERAMLEDTTPKVYPACRLLTVAGLAALSGGSGRN